MELKVSVIFNERPKRWGLRGEPFLWSDLENVFSELLMPCTEDEFIFKMEEYFFKLTGHKLDENNNFYMEKYSKGGMSSGYICPRVWREKLIPLLVKRLLKYNWQCC